LIPFAASVLRVQQSGGIGFGRCRHRRVGDEGAASAVVLNVEVARCERRSFCVQPFRGPKMWYSSLSETFGQLLNGKTNLPAGVGS
jgi:hypothetical protein